MDWYAKKEAQLELVPGFRKLLENMHKDGKRLAIATGKSREGMKRVFNATGIEHLFECVQTADTNFSKPNPGMLLAIADESGLETKDSGNGWRRGAGYADGEECGIGFCGGELRRQSERAVA